MKKLDGKTVVVTHRPTCSNSEFVVIKEATAAPQHPDLGDGYKVALINFRYIANTVLSTDEVIQAMA